MVRLPVEVDGSVLGLEHVDLVAKAIPRIAKRTGISVADIANFLQQKGEDIKKIVDNFADSQVRGDLNLWFGRNRQIVQEICCPERTNQPLTLSKLPHATYQQLLCIMYLCKSTQDMACRREKERKRIARQARLAKIVVIKKPTLWQRIVSALRKALAFLKIGKRR